MMKKALSLLLSIALIGTLFSGCKNDSSASPQPETAKIVETNGTFENENLSFKVPVGWTAQADEQDPDYPTVTCQTKSENGFAAFINFYSTEQNDAFLTYTDKDVDMSPYYTAYTLYENSLKKIKDRDVRVTRYRGENSGIAVYVKIYAFNDCGRTYNLALSSPDEITGIDELYTIYDSFSGKPPVSKEETTTSEPETTTAAPEYNIDTANFRVYYPDGWISDVSGRNAKVDMLQYWYSRRLNNVPVFISNEEINGFYPYISVIVGDEDENLIKQEDKYLDFSSSFKNYEQGKIERGSRSGTDTLTLNYSVENEDGVRIYIKQILFNEKQHLYVLSLFSSSETYGLNEFQKFYDTFYTVEE